MDPISFSHADQQKQRIEKVIANPDSTSGVITVPKTIARGETVTVPAGRVAVLPNVQVDGTLNVEGEVFIPSGTTFSKVVNTEGNQTIAGIKTFSSSPIVPIPTTGAQSANKDYVDLKVARVTSTDNAIVRFNGTTGEVQNSNVTIDDAGVINYPAHTYSIPFTSHTWSGRVKHVASGVGDAIASTNSYPMFGELYAYNITDPTIFAIYKVYRANSTAAPIFTLIMNGGGLVVGASNHVGTLTMSDNSSNIHMYLKYVNP